MKKIVLFNILLFAAGVFQAQTLTPSENYIYTRTYLEPVTAPNAAAKQLQSVQYFDGLGRTKQQVAIKATANGKDLVIPSEYDPSGRQTKSYLPVPVNSLNGALQSTTGNSVNSYYGVSNAYSEALLEKSPLGRVLKQAHPGTEWQMNTSHTVKFEYGTNSGNEVKRLKAVTTWSTTNLINDVSVSFAPDDNFTAGGYYKANTLVKKVTRDEDDKETQVFTNASGQTLLVRKVNNTGTVQYTDTYYVYDEFGNLVLVIPPKATFSTITELSGHLNTLCYQYRYDKYNRLAEKKLPGKTNWESVVYDKQNRPVLTQDSNQRSKQWSFVKYDEFGRIAYSGLFDDTSSRASLQTALDNMSSNALNNEERTQAPLTFNSLNVYYTNNAFPTGGISVLSVNYYDSYPAGSPAMPAKILEQDILPATPVSITSNGYTTSRSVKTLPTASYTKNIEDSNWSSAFIWYDRQGRVVGTYGKNHLGGYTKTETELDFSGTAKQSFMYHKRLDTDTETVIKQRFVYDDQKRIKQQYHQVNSQPEELLSDNTYNDLGQLVNKKVGNNLQSIDYTYNLRGSLIKVNDPANLGGKLFGYEIKYQNPVDIEQRYNGSITEVDWKTATDNVLRRYDYRYDGLNRLTQAHYREPLSSVPYNNFYNEEADYDLNGNIASLRRNTKGISGTAELIDQLDYDYTGNTLTSVTDNSANYKGYPDTSGNKIHYDANGSMIDHIDKGILQIDYNFLNLPTYIKFNESITSRKGTVYVNTKYTYSSDGTKLKKEYNYKDGANLSLGTITTDYLDGFQYEANINLTSPAGPPVLKFIPTSEGYYNFENNKYIYSYTDHLGNVRLSYVKNSSGSAEVLEENNFYPFGLKHEGYNPTTGNPAYNYQYNGKELQKETGWSDFGARMYMADMARWGVMDPLAEMMRRHSPYNFAYNNPVNFIDPDGMAPREFAMASENSPVDVNWGERNYYLGSLSTPAYDYLSSPMASGGGSAYTFTGNAAGSMFNYFANGGSINGISFNNGYANWWTGIATQTSYKIGNELYGEAETGLMHSVKFGGLWDNIGDFFQDHFVFKTELSGSIGVQVGAKLGGPLQANAEAGILSTEIGKLGWSYNDGFYAKYGDGKGHNFAAIGIKLLSKKLSVGGKADYVTNHAIPTAGDLLEYYPNNGHLEWEANMGPGKSHWSPQKGSDADILNIGLKSKLRGSNKESCTYCADLGVGFKALLGVDIKLIIGFK